MFTVQAQWVFVSLNLLCSANRKNLVVEFSWQKRGPNERKNKSKLATARCLRQEGVSLSATGFKI